MDKEIIVDGSNPKWKKDLEILLLDLSERKIQNAVVYTTHATASDIKFISIINTNKYDTKILFVCDEVHATGAEKQRDALLDIYEYRIGLSATPDRMFDIEGTSIIREYFGEKSYEFTIADALNTVNPKTGKPFLNQFEYYPVFIDLTEEENNQYARLSQKIAILRNQEDFDPEELQRLYDRRARIGKNAVNKLPALRRLLVQLDPPSIKDTILFASDKQIEPSFQIMSELHIKRAKITEFESATKIVNREGEKEMAKTITTMRDSNGNDIPLKYVSKYDKAKDRAVRRVLSRFLKAREMLEGVVAETIAELQALADTKEKLGAKGNFSARSFDGLIQVSIRQQYNIFLDERVVRARELMLGYVERVLAKVGGNDAAALRLIVAEAFKANTQGFLSTGKIMSLLKMEIDNADWRAAKRILQDSIRPQKGKRYLVCERRASTQAEFRPVRLDIADCWPEECGNVANVEISNSNANDQLGTGNTGNIGKIGNIQQERR